MIFNQTLRAHVLDAIDRDVRFLMGDAPGVRRWIEIKELSEVATKISQAPLDEDMSVEIYSLVEEWADAYLLEESAYAEMDDALRAAETDMLGDNPDLELDTVWYDLVQAVADQFEPNEFTAEWVRLKLGRL